MLIEIYQAKRAESRKTKCFRSQVTRGVFSLRKKRIFIFLEVKCNHEHNLKY